MSLWRLTSDLIRLLPFIPMCYGHGRKTRGESDTTVRKDGWPRGKFRKWRSSLFKDCGKCFNHHNTKLNSSKVIWGAEEELNDLGVVVVDTDV